MPEKMIKNRNNLFRCLGICQRLFNFIVNNLVPKRVTPTSHSMRQRSTTVPILSAVRPDWRKIEYHEAQAQAHLEKPAQIKARETGPIQMVLFNDEDDCDDERIRKRKGKGVVVSQTGGEKSTVEEVKLHNYPPTRQRQVRPLFDVAVNINEKSDAFIRSRKEAMRRNYISEA